MIIVSMSEDELHAHWDRIEQKMGLLEPPYWSRSRPSEYLLQAHRNGFITWDQAVDLYMAATGLATTDP